MTGPYDRPPAPATEPTDTPAPLPEQMPGRGDIGEILGLSPRTVTKHLEGIYEKLGVENRTAASVIAARHLQDLD